MTSKGGRPSIYTEEMAAEICRRLAQGETLRSICRDENMPDRSTITDWVVNDREGFSAHYARARDMQIEYWADDIIDIADNASNDWMERNGEEDNQSWQLNGEHVQRSRLRSDNRKWLLARLKPEKYGDRTKLDHGVQDSLADLMKEIDGRHGRIPSEGES